MRYFNVVPVNSTADKEFSTNRNFRSNSFLIQVKEIIDWWIPYLFGASKEWKNHYLKIFAETTIMLSAIRDNPIPNLEHCILHTLTLLSFLSIIVYYLIIYMP
ncbi:MAG: hypothetical protein IPJ20_18145 [Flammeovirgaceae bacterium]|jgi:hypothetical protein|nr:hypothetical protein [Flammeovirgaceae bacterium]